MALPLPKTTEVFKSDTTVAFRAHYWDTSSTAVRISPAFPEPMTAAGSGVQFGIFNLLDPDFNPADSDEIEAALAKTSGVTTSVLGYTPAGAYRTGVVPLIYHYWGAGAPPGGSRSKAVLLKFSGYVRDELDAATFIFAGQGTVYAVVTRAGSGHKVVICSGKVHAPDALVELTRVNASVIHDEWGYLFNPAPIALNVGDWIDIYYWHNGEPWGGIAAKVIHGTVDTESDQFLTQVRHAPPIGASFMAPEPTPIQAREIAFVDSAELKVSEGGVQEFRLRVALASPDEPDGWVYTKSGDDKRLVHNADPSQTLKLSRMVHFEAGYARPDGTLELYPRFTGYINDIFPDADGETAIIECRGITGRLTEAFDENFPDRLSYHASGYILRERAAEPVYPIPAYDYWEIEVAIADLCYKAGIDPENLGKTPWNMPNVGRRRFLDTTSQQTVFGARLFAARMLADPDERITLEGNTNYGNVLPLQKDFLPKDDEYLFKPEVTKRAYDRANGMASQYGYDFYFDAEGQGVLGARNNPVYFQYLSQPGTYSPSIPAGVNQRVAVSAVGGVVFERRHAQGAWSRVIEGHFSRLDLYAGVGVNAQGLNGGRIQVAIEVHNGSTWVPVSTSVVSTALDAEEGFYYDDVVRSDGTNAAVLRLMSLPFDHYRVTLTPAGPEGGSGDCVYRLNGVAVYERDAERPAYETTLSTKRLIYDITPESGAKDSRNQVFVVGQRKAVVTDSAKLAETSNPNNPEREFHVAVAVDPFSIYDPLSPNFAGMKRMVILFEEKVTDSEFARWLAREILLRSRVPKEPAKFRHPAIPTLELRDALYVVEEQHKSVDHLLWTTDFIERWTADEAVVEVSGVAYPEIPSYQPREDIDIDQYFVDPVDGKGEPVVDLQISYLNLYKRPVTNVHLTDATAIKGFATRPDKTFSPRFHDEVNSASGMTLSRVAIPATMYLGWNINASQDGSFGLTQGRQGYYMNNKRVLVNNPYRHFFEIAGWTPDHRPILNFTFEEGDGRPGTYDKAHYEFPFSSNGAWYVCYDALQPRVNAQGLPTENPYYDPYTSEAGNLVSVKFQQLVKGRVRVSVWDANKAEGRETPVAWLTAPTADPEEPEAHWVYAEPGEAEYLWDGIDNIGFWNTLNTLDYGEEIKGAFGEKPTVVGRGFFVANDKGTSLHTMIGDTSSGNFDSDNSPFYTIGRFGQFYVKVEVMNDKLMRKDLRETGRIEPRIVDTNRLPLATTSGTTLNDVPATFVWTHLSEPTQVAIRIQDYVGAAPWTRGMQTSDADWGPYSTPDAEATIRDGKPVRLTFQMLPRRSPFFRNSNGQPDVRLQGVKLTRRVHLKATWLDQYWNLTGKTWQDFDPKFQVGANEQKRLNSRMYHNDDHTLEFEDASWRTGETLASYEWVFDPSLFIKDFGKGIKERLRYGDFEQLEALPGFDPKHLGGTSQGQRSYMLLAFVSYLFYFDAFALDRSGRRQWCLNSWFDVNGNRRGFIDRSKIVTTSRLTATDNPGQGSYTPRAIVQYERDGAELYLMRSIFVRQWKEPGWASGSYSGSPVSQYGIVNPHQLKFVQTEFRNFDPRLGYFVDPVNADRDRWLDAYQRTGSGLNRWLRNKTSKSTGLTTIPTLDGIASTMIKPTSFGSWEFDRPGLTGMFTPSPCRDFHPYWRFPFMPNKGMIRTWSFIQSEEPRALDVLSCTSSHILFPLRDPAAKEEWYGYAFGDAYAASHPAHNDSEYYYGARLEQTVEEYGADKSQTIPLDQLAALFDYRRSDQLDRWDQFRGVLSRGPYADRTAEPASTYIDASRKLAAPSQPVAPSGVYLLNLARYFAYYLAPVHRAVPDTYSHFVDFVTDWFDLRFHHEYVWYSPRFFPVTPEGGAVYGYVRDEYTQVSRWYGAPWWASQGEGRFARPRGSPDPRVFDPQTLSFDAGAWTGWKPDITPGDWAIAPYLRWYEINALTRVGVMNSLVENATGVPSPTLTDTYQQGWLNATPPSPQSNYRVVNLFDEYESRPMRARLAVGPEVPESRRVIVNLVLPARLSGL